MLELAYEHQSAVDSIYSELMMEDRIKWISSTPIFNRPDWNQLRAGNYEKQLYLSIKMTGEEDAEILGEIGYSIDHWAQSIDGFHCIRYNQENDTDNGYIFMKDMLHVIHEAFTRFGYRKMNWSVIVGNPAEKAWDKFCKLSGGRIVGTFKEEALTADHVFRDMKHYELFARDFYETPLGKRCIKMFKDNK